MRFGWRLALVLLLAVMPWRAFADPLVIGETFTLRSVGLNEERRINVYLPAAYSTGNDAHLPVLYMADGGLQEDFPHIAGLVQILAANGSMRPFILVGIENTERRRDLTGPTDDPEDLKMAPHAGGSAKFRTFMRDELMPAIKARYRTTDERAVIGESLAGLFVVETLLLEPKLFDTYIAVDPSLWWNKQTLVKQAEVHLKKRQGVASTLFLAGSGGEGNGGVVEAFGVALKVHAPANLRWQHETMTGETHGTIFHPAALKALRTLFKPKA